MERNTHHYYHIRRDIKSPTGTTVNFSVQAHRFNNVRSFKLKRISIPYSFYPINSNNNSITIFKTGDTQDRTAVIEPGNYSLNQFKTELKNKLDALAGPASTFTITDNDTTAKLTIASTVSYIYRGTSTINNIIGFANTDTTNALSHTGVNVYNIAGTHYIQLRSDQLTKYDTQIRTGDGKGGNLLDIIPLGNFSFGDTINIDYDDHIFDYHPKAENDIDIELRNEFDKLLGGDTALNGQEPVFTLQFQSYNNNHPKLLSRSDPRKFRNSGYGTIIN